MSTAKQNYPRMIARLLADRDIQGLSAVLRQPGDAGMRASAAEALAESGDTSATEMLVRSSLEDPEGSVRAAARKALDQLVGGQAEMAIAVHRSAESDPEPWLVEADETRVAADGEESPVYSAQIRRFLAENDASRLGDLLRNRESPAVRAQAALALAELGSPDAAELLVRATREDPEPDVQAAAQQALMLLFGSQAESVLSSYPADTGGEEPWLIEPGDLEHDLDDGEAAEREELSTTDLESVNRIAMYEGNETLRLQAIEVLAHSSDMRATETLANLALWGDNRRLRAAARQALDDRYGEQAEEIINSYRIPDREEAVPSSWENALEEGIFPNAKDDEDYDDEEDDDDVDDEDEEDNDVDDEDNEPGDGTGEVEEVVAAGIREPPVSSARSPYPTVQPDRRGGQVVQEYGVSWWIIVLAVLGFALIAAAFFMGGK